VRASSWAVVGALATTGCSSAQVELPAPQPSIGETVPVEEAARPLIRRWMQAEPAARGEMEKTLSDLARRYPRDSLARLLDALAGWSALERGDLVVAEQRSQSAVLGPPGVTRDLGTLVTGVAARRAGDARRAMRLLWPLLHKMLDPLATALLDEELVRAAVATADWETTLRLVDVLIVEAAPAERERVLARISSLFRDVPVPRLVDHLRTRASSLGSATREERRLLESLAQFLARRAVADKNVPLARTLLQEAGPLLGPTGEDVARLAGDRTRGRVTARTVGVLLALGGPMLERRSADVVTGLSFGMGIGDSGARLVSRDDGGDPLRVERALAELAAEGAAVIVAGIDPRHVAPAATFAEEQGLAVVLLTASGLTSVTRSTRTFVLGEPAARSIGSLAAALRDDGAKVVAGVGAVLGAGLEELVEPAGTGVEFGCDPTPTAAQLAGERVDALVVADGAYCGSEVAALAREQRLPLALGLGSLTNIKRAEGARVLEVGIFPVPAERGASDLRLVGWLESGRPTPNWWMALGRDAAVLAGKAVRELGDAASDDEVRARRGDAVAALSAAKAELWTSAASGFAGDRTILRELAIRKVRGGKVIR